MDESPLSAAAGGGAVALATPDQPSLVPLEVASSRREAWRRFSANKLALVGMAMLLLVVVLAVFAPLIAPQGPTRLNLLAINQAPSAHHLLGTDADGRDVWARTVYGARVSLSVGLGAVALALVVGTAMGLLAGILAGWWSGLIMRVTDAFMSVPAILLAILFVSVAGPSLTSIIICIALATWTQSARLVRGEVLLIREREFVLASYIVGVPRWRVVRDHVLPNVLGPLTVLGTFSVANAILTEASLSFLGLGVRPPTPSWGQMVSAAESPVVLLSQPWIWIPPAVAIAFTVLAVNFIGEGLRAALDPKGNR